MKAIARIGSESVSRAEVGIRRAAIQNTASAAGLLIAAEAMIAELPKKSAGGPAMLPGGGMGGMDF